MLSVSKSDQRKNDLKWVWLKLSIIWHYEFNSVSSTDKYAEDTPSQIFN